MAHSNSPVPDLTGLPLNDILDLYGYAKQLDCDDTQPEEDKIHASQSTNVAVVVSTTSFNSNVTKIITKSSCFLSGFQSEQQKSENIRGACINVQPSNEVFLSTQNLPGESHSNAEQLSQAHVLNKPTADYPTCSNFLDDVIDEACNEGQYSKTMQNVIFIRQNSTSDSDSEASSEIAVKFSLAETSASKKPLDSVEERPSKRGKPSQEWEVIDEMILNEDINDNVIKKIKNNEASRLHRAKKKQKFDELFTRKCELEKHNAQLTMQLQVMQREINLLKQLLMSKMKNNEPS